MGGWTLITHLETQSRAESCGDFQKIPSPAVDDPLFQDLLVDKPLPFPAFTLLAFDNPPD
jgi:hypothetical protein